jgi:putative tricarboxylic transport membrane protein
MHRDRILAAGFPFVLAVGATALLFVAWKIPVREVDMLLGPRLFPLAVMAALAVLATFLAISGMFPRATTVQAEAVNEPNDWSAVGWVLLGLILFGVLVESAGFVIGAATLFVAVARGFGSRRLLVDAGIGLALAGSTYLLFVHGLDLHLPSGTLFSAWMR